MFSELIFPSLDPVSHYPSLQDAVSTFVFSSYNFSSQQFIMQCWKLAAESLMTIKLKLCLCKWEVLKPCFLLQLFSQFQQGYLNSCISVIQLQRWMRCDVDTLLFPILSLLVNLVRLLYIWASVFIAVSCSRSDFKRTCCIGLVGVFGLSGHVNLTLKMVRAPGSRIRTENSDGVLQVFNDLINTYRNALYMLPCWYAYSTNGHDQPFRLLT